MIISLGVAADDCIRYTGGTGWPGTFANFATYTTLRRDHILTIYTVDVIFLRFNTSVIPPGATITSAKLYLYIDYIAEPSHAPAGSIYGEYYLPANWPPVQGDGSVEADPTAFTVAPPFAEGTWLSPDLSNLGSISRDGYTGFRLVLGTGEPPQEFFDSTIRLSSYEMADGNAAYLDVEYTGGASQLAMFVR